MDALLQQLLEGIDPTDPAASWHIFWRLMGWVDWWLLIWLTVVFTAVGGLIGWWRGAFWRDLCLGAALGPLGWIVSVLLPSVQRRCPQCRTQNPRNGTQCRRCAAPMGAAPRT